MGLMEHMHGTPEHRNIKKTTYISWDDNLILSLGKCFQESRAEHACN